MAHHTNATTLLFVPALWRNIVSRVTTIHRWVILVTFLAVFVRFYNSDQFLYFIYDQGRDAWKLHEMASGDLTLIGPTSGLPGFFLGPLWYYAGLPGYLLSSGSPYGISLWYIFLATLALPFFWLLSKRLFNQPFWQLVAYALLCFIPGSIAGATFIWNPLISIPLMAVGTWSLLGAKNSRLLLILSFFCFGLVLHSEFAYGVFLLPVLYLLIFWIRGKFSILDYIISAIAISVTLLPQVAFELKNNFIMTRALWEGTASSETSVPLIKVWLERPMQLVDATRQLLIGNMAGSYLVIWLAIPLLVGSGIWLWRYSHIRLSQETRKDWQIIAIIAITPYLGYMFWTGNYGNFFSYYVTPHFISLTLLLVLGIRRWSELPGVLYISTKVSKSVAQQISVALVAVLLTTGVLNTADVTVFPRNEAGMHIVKAAVKQTMDWQEADMRQVQRATNQDFTSSITTFTPNYLTAQYDYFLHWQSRIAQRSVPHTQARHEDSIVYTIIEPDKEIPEKRFAPWYENVATNRVLIRRKRLGVLLLETWANPVFAEKNNLPEPYLPPITEQMGWK